MKAIVQGEFHVSKSDQESLESKITDDVDALFIEGRRDRYSPEKWSFGYIYFLFGTFLIYWFQDLLSRIRGFSEEYPVPVHDEIDTELPVLYDRFPRTWKVLASLFPLVFVYLSLIAPQIPILILDPPYFISIPYSLSVKTMMVVGSALLYSVSLIYFEQRMLGGREEDMANSMIEKSNEMDYQKIVVCCGEAHLDQISKLLENEGWDVKPNSTDRKISAKIWP